jgi:hypothetical protein
MIARHPASSTTFPGDSPGEDGHRLTFHFFSSPCGINWDSPRKLFLSALLNRLHPRDRKLSHIAVELRGPRTQAVAAAAYGSMSSMSERGRNTVRRLLVDQIGLGMMLANYPGALEAAGPLRHETRRKEPTGRVQRVTYLLPEATAFRVQRYLAEYPATDNHAIYGGLASHPRYGEGAGCVAYARAVSEIAGLDQDRSQARWSRKIRIPKQLIGDPRHCRRVPITRLVWGEQASRWADEAEPHVEINFYDPDRIFREIAAAGAAATRRAPPRRAEDTVCGGDATVRRHGRCYELVYDRRDLATPTEPLWLSRPRAHPAPLPAAEPLDDALAVGVPG